jgi:hypothetical protein
MELTTTETAFLTALIHEQNQTGCHGPAHDLLRERAYPDAPRTGPGSLAFSYETVPLTSLLLRNLNDLQQVDDFVRCSQRNPNPEWPWSSAAEYRARLDQARDELQSTERAPGYAIKN